MLVYVWLAVVVFTLIIEFSTTDMISIWFAGGALVALILAAFNVWWVVQLIAFIVVSAVLLALFRKFALKKLNAKTVNTNADQAIGKEYRLLSPIGLNQVGTIKINDVIWNVDTKEQEQEIPEGVIVRILEIKGNKYIVEEVK